MPAILGETMFGNDILPLSAIKVMPMEQSRRVQDIPGHFACYSKFCRIEDFHNDLRGSQIANWESFIYKCKACGFRGQSADEVRAGG